jgi:transcriptional regulator
MVIFAGPHAYVSPRHYERVESVPTWNYAAVHAYGVPELIASAEEKYQLMEKLILQNDPGYLTQFRDLRSEYVDNRLSAVVAFTIEVKRLQARFKLSQDRLLSERARIIAALESTGDGEALETAQLMRVHTPPAPE